MKKKFLIPALFLATSISFTSCGEGAGEEGKDGENQDAVAFCDCVDRLLNDKDQGDCDEKMEKLEEDLKNDEERFNAFAEAAKKKCPEGNEFIDRLK